MNWAAVWQGVLDAQIHVGHILLGVIVFVLGRVLKK